MILTPLLTPLRARYVQKRQATASKGIVLYKPIMKRWVTPGNKG